MTDPDGTTRTRRRRVAIFVLGIAAMCALVAIFGIDWEPSAPSRETGTRSALSAAAPGESVEGANHRRASARRIPTRIDASAPLPEPGTRLAPIYAELKARADAGDGAAASRLYRDLHRCLSAATDLRVAVLAGLEPEDIPANAAADVRAKLQAAMEQERVTRAERLRKAQQDAKLCDGLDREQQFVLPAMRRAAELGDADAQTCYLSGHDLWKQGALDHPEWMAEYKANALAIAEAALERGNQVAVVMLAVAYSADGFDATPLGHLVEPDPIQYYRYNKLAALFSPDRDAADARLAAAASALSPTDRAAADAWAQDMYVRYFRASQRRPTALCEPDMTEELNAGLHASAAARK